ncbi:MAG: alpha/beta hydrolase [Bifidobacteriaceae bacterium]|jgi:pimeloyl-ACP methyl ester carboxylesterase|nr:alpha/beta hydrolase [Bifidobacteriaceae bacterium]
MSTDFSLALIEGPWRHEFLAAGGSRFHVALAGPDTHDSPLVVLLHGFPQFWWAWRHQIPALATAGYRVAALDLRGYGASDKPPIGHNLPHLAGDVAAVINALGAASAVVVGQGLGGLVAWTMTAYCPNVLTAAVVLNAPHPAVAAFRPPILVSPRAWTQTTAWLLPVAPKRALRSGQMVRACLQTWSATGWNDPEAANLYCQMMQVPFAAAKAIDQLRWLLRTPLHGDAHRFLAQFRRHGVAVPILHLQAGLDHFWRPSAMPVKHLGGPDYRFRELAGVGHFLAEEAAQPVTEQLLSFLQQVC